jgi:hypothetical protein
MKRMLCVAAVIIGFLVIVDGSFAAAPFYQGKTVRVTVVPLVVNPAPPSPERFVGCG